MANLVKNKVICICDKDVILELNKIDHIKDRAKFMFNLIKSYELFNQMDVVKATPASFEDLIEFHSSLYIDTIRNINLVKEEDLEEFGLSGDCPVLDDLYKFISLIGGSSLTAARALLSRKYKYAINWCGGWHHAQRDSAEGFCYVNDIVLAILQLCKQFDRVLYIDLDVHHGNGVENAFLSTQKVFTFSLHRNGVGFYPNTGDLNDVGSGKGKYYTANVPFDSGTNDKIYLQVFYSVIKVIRESFKPDCLVVQCGADSLAGDVLGDFNMSSQAFGEIISHLVSWSLPSLFLGGGGYNVKNSARYWTYLTSIITQTEISDDISDECDDFMEYGPDYSLSIQSLYSITDKNTSEHINNIIQTLTHNIANYVTAPGNPGINQLINPGIQQTEENIEGKKEIQTENINTDICYKQNTHKICTENKDCTDNNINIIKRCIEKNNIITNNKNTVQNILPHNYINKNNNVRTFLSTEENISNKKCKLEIKKNNIKHILDSTYDFTSDSFTENNISVHENKICDQKNETNSIQQKQQNTNQNNEDKNYENIISVQENKNTYGNNYEKLISQENNINLQNNIKDINIVHNKNTENLISNVIDTVLLNTEGKHNSLVGNS